MQREDDRSEIDDVTAMADVNLENESKMMTQNNIGTEIRHAPQGDEPIAVTKNGNIRNISLNLAQLDSI